MTDQTILMIAPFPPIPDSGGGIAIYSDLYELKRRGIIVDLVCFQSDRRSESIRLLERVCRQLILVEGPPPWSPRVMMRALRQKCPMIVARHETSPMRLAIKRQIAAETYDVILVEFSFMCQYLMQPGSLLDGPDRPLIAVDHHVVSPKVYQYFYGVERDPLLRLFRRFEIPRLKKYLHQVLVFGDKHLFLGQEDLDYIRTQISDTNWAKKLVYRPTGLLLERYPLSDPAQAEPYTIGFFGSFDWEANIDAVLYFVEEILPLIRQQLPQVKFVVAGRAAPNQVRNLDDQSFIDFVGEVDDMFSVAQRVALIAVPLRVGAGTRLKILEAMAWGKPVITTPIGVEGIEHVADEDLIVADTRDSFAEATIALFNDPAQQRRLARAGRRRVESFYSAQQSVDQLQNILTDL